MIIVDWSQICIAASFAFPNDFKKGKPREKMEGMFRHLVLHSLLSYRSQWGKTHGNIVICAEGGNTWRKDQYRHYKGNRGKKRDDSDVDWEAIFQNARGMFDEMVAFFPFKTVRVPRAEADDSIATLVKYTQENELIQDGLEESPQKVIVISSDGDFKQLFKYRNYQQYNPIMKKAVAKPERTFLLEKILIGDGGDFIPNSRSGDDTLVEGIRQKPITAKLKEQFFSDPTGKCFPEEMQRNIERNRLLIDFDYIPGDLARDIVDNYESNVPVKDKQLIFDYMTKYRMRTLVDRLQEFY